MYGQIFLAYCMMMVIIVRVATAACESEKKLRLIFIGVVASTIILGIVLIIKGTVTQ